MIEGDVGVGWGGDREGEQQANDAVVVEEMDSDEDEERAVELPAPLLQQASDTGRRPHAGEDNDDGIAEVDMSLTMGSMDATENEEK